MARKLEVVIVGDASSLERAFGKGASASSKFGKGLKSLGKVAAIGVGAAFAGLAATLKVGFDELSEGQKVAAQTAATLKSTGGVANVTAQQVARLAEEQSRLTGIDDELIQTGSNLLLTFKNVRNEVGKGSDIFDRATKSALDLSIAGFGSVESASKMLGKALNDPVKGMTALGRAGVTFSEEQKKAIKSLVETGDVLGAQKLILAEVESQVGGSAKAYGETLPGQLSKLRNSFEEVAGSVATTLLPYLIDLLAWVNANMPTIQRVIKTTLDAVVATIEFLVPIIGKLIGWFQMIASAAQRYWPVVQEAAERVVAWYRANLEPAIRNVITAITVVWRKFGDDVVNIVGRALGILKTVVGTALGNIASVIQAILAVLRGDWSTAWNEIKEIPIRTLRAAVSVIKGLAGLFLSAGAALGRALIEGIVSGLSGLTDMVYDKIKGGISSAIGKVKGFFGIGSPSRVTADEIGKPLSAGVLLGWVDGSRELPGKMKESVENAIQAAIAAIRNAQGALGQAFSVLTQEALSAFDKLSSEIETRTERKIRQQDERRAAQDRQRALRDAEAQLTAARAEFAGTTTEDPEAMARAVENIMAAERAVADAKFEIQRAADLKQAERERKALENRRALQRRHFEEELLALQNRLIRGELTVEQFNQRLVVLFKKYQVPFKNAAIKLGAALAEGLQEAAVLVGRQAQAVRNEIMKHLSNIQVRVNVDVVVPDRPDRRQHGGPVRAGTPYVVGEAGPELFVPSTNGQIVPNNAMSNARAMGGGDVVNLNFYGPTVGTSREFEDTVRRALYDVQRRNPGTGVAFA